MAWLLLLFCLFVASSLACATPLLGCGFGDRQTTPADRIKNFLDCLRNQGHDDEILTELRKSFEAQLATPSAAAAASGPAQQKCAPDTESYELGRLPYCSGMSELQCRSLMLVLDSLVNASPRSSYGGGGISIEKFFQEDPAAADSSASSSSSSSSDAQGTQAALMNIILARFNDILEEYKRWRQETTSRQKRSTEEDSAAAAVPAQPPSITDDKNGNKNTTSGQKIDSSSPPAEEGAKFEPETTSSRPVHLVRAPRQADSGLPFKMLAKLSPEEQALLQGYLAWRERNGYGKQSGRWG